MYTYIYIYIFWTVSFTGVLFYISVPRPYNVSACRHSASSRHLRCVIAPNTHSTCSTACHQEAALVCKHAEKSTNQRLETQRKGLVCKNTDHRMLFFSFFINASQMCTHLPYFMNSHFFGSINAIVDYWNEFKIYCRISPLFLTTPAQLYLHFTFPVKSTGCHISIHSAWVFDGHLNSPTHSHHSPDVTDTFCRCSPSSLQLLAQYRWTLPVDSHSVDRDHLTFHSISDCVF